MGRNEKTISKSSILGVDILIFVTLGTQDKQFKRLLDAVENINVDEKIIAQVGSTEYKSKKMEVHKFLSQEEFEKYMKNARIVITHAGVGTIIYGLNLGKKMIVCARRKEYKEHVNDHQMQILETFSKEGYIIPLEDFSKLEERIKEAEKFKPKKFKSNNKNFVEQLDKEIIKLTKTKE